MMSQLSRFFALTLFIGILSACEGINVTGPDTFERPNDKWQQRDRQTESIFGGDGLTFGGKEQKRGSQGTGIGVNAFLWRATLDTISFMPLASADPFGGVVLTDWHSPAESPQERFKLNVYILGQALRADGIRVAAFRQVKNNANEWQAVNMDPKAVTDIENAILTRARQLRSESATQ
ncbi:MAG: DUF3576 domain-containing protein [Methylocystaceae bacterium]|nr:DUF3576 domain-containing protein [Methylocystaceae bacterium]